MLGAAIVWLCAAFGLLLTVLWTGSAAALTALAALVVFVLVAGILSAVQARNVSLRLTLPPSAAKNEDIRGLLTIAADTRLPAVT